MSEDEVNDVTLGEVYRSLLRFEKKFEKKIDEMDENYVHMVQFEASQQRQGERIGRLEQDVARIPTLIETSIQVALRPLQDQVVRLSETVRAPMKLGAQILIGVVVVVLGAFLVAQWVSK